MVTLTILILIALDQISKLAVLKHLAGGGEVTLIPGFFRLLYVENRGAAFGILQEGRPLFIIITIAVIGFLIYAIYRKREEVKGMLRMALVLILAGAVGNFIDRLRLHFVVDFLSFRFFGRDFAVFNLADSFIVVGTILLMIHVLFGDEKDSHVS